ncbi:hypothetical protein GCM10025867_19930 [Frondihabitans sucicola]|uniref:DUF6457 domain-containing protein n=1 Tax=Frondihabitans sucicola TaxID=1268041 RepID=A0ABM8GMX8_9MICO|nr:DUF6457 domain-containing protein [Frondihabitans sucicola]BDZ49752.1 hypothetical protein GCM10025867_19930 [Frondihabitans sucicola]
MTDTPADLDAWAAKLAAALRLPDDVEIDVPAVLDLARDAAHGVARPAAPLTTFLVGLAAGLGGASPDDLARSFETARQLAAAEQA